MEQTDKLPSANVRLSPAFCQSLIFSLQMNGRGRSISKKSVIILGMELPKNVFLVDTQCPLLGYQRAERGWHCTKVVTSLS